MSINGFGVILKNYEERLREIGLSDDAIQHERAKLLAQCAMRLPMVSNKEKSKLAKMALKEP